MGVKNFISLVDQCFDKDDIKVILDIGSRDGNESIELSTAFPKAKVFAFECNPDAIKIWKSNVKKKNVALIECAVSDVNEDIDFYKINPDKNGNIGASSMFLANPEFPYETYVQTRIRVSSITIDSWAEKNGIETVDLIWIDTQGAELAAFRGMKNILKHVKMIHTEVEFRPIYIGQPLFEEVDAFLKHREFTFVRFDYRCSWFGDADYVKNGCRNCST